MLVEPELCDAPDDGVLLDEVVELGALLLDVVVGLGDDVLLPDDVVVEFELGGLLAEEVGRSALRTIFLPCATEGQLLNHLPKSVITVHHPSSKLS